MKTLGEIFFIIVCLSLIVFFGMGWLLIKLGEWVTGRKCNEKTIKQTA